MSRISWTHVLTFNSVSSDKVYEVKRDPKTKAWGCSCPAWMFQKKPVDVRSCKHTIAAEEAAAALESKDPQRIARALRKLEEMGAQD